MLDDFSSSSFPSLLPSSFSSSSSSFFFLSDFVVLISQFMEGGEGAHPGAHCPTLSWLSRSDHCSSPGLPRRLRSTSLLWRGSTTEALSLLKDDVLVADPGTR